MSKLETNTIDTVSGTSTLQVGSTNTSTITLGVSGDTINVPSGVTIANSGTATGFGGANTPAFEAYLSTNQTFSDSSYAKVNFNTEIYDTDSDYDNSSNYRFTPTTAGKYLVYSTIVMYASGLTYAALNFYKNGSLHKECDLEVDAGTEQRVVISSSTVIDFNGSSDYVEIYGYLDSTSGTPTFRGSGTEQCNFGAFKIIT
jgi:hypothetical protein